MPSGRGMQHQITIVGPKQTETINGLIVVDVDDEAKQEVIARCFETFRQELARILDGGSSSHVVTR